MEHDYSYQKRLLKEIEEAFKTHDVVLLAAAPGAGKTRMAIDFIKQQNYPQVLILAHNQAMLRSQWNEFMDKYDVAHSIVKGREQALAWNESGARGITLTIPQSLRLIGRLSRKINLLIVDEAHQYFSAPMVKGIIEQTKPDKTLILTGTPALFINNPKIAIVGISLEEMLESGTVTDPIIELVESSSLHSVDDYDDKLEIGTDVASFTAVNTQMEELLQAIVLRLTSRNRTNPEQYHWIKEVGDWKSLLNRLGKTMIACRTIKQAQDVELFLRERGVGVILSVSGQDWRKEQTKESFHEFKVDSSIKVLVVVRRGVLGFNFEDLENIIDLTYSLNASRVFQLLCRVIRNGSKNQDKLYLKVCGRSMTPITYFVMSFVVALCTKKYFYSHSENLKKRSIPVPRDFAANIRKHIDPLAKNEWGALPALFTMKELAQKGSIRSVAYTSFNRVLQSIYGKKKAGVTGRVYDLTKVEALLGKVKSRKQFAEKYPGFYGAILRYKQTHLLDERFGPLFRYTEDNIKELIRNSPSLVCFRTNHPGAYNWLKIHGKIELCAHLRGQNTNRREPRDQKIFEFFKDKNFTVHSDGTIDYNGAPMRVMTRRTGANFTMKLRKKGRVPIQRKANELKSILFRRKWLSINRIMWFHFYGSLDPKMLINRIDRNKPPTKDNLIAQTHISLPGRMNRGNQKYSDKVIREIREDSKNGLKQKELIEKYGLAKSTLSYILRGKIRQAAG